MDHSKILTPYEIFIRKTYLFSLIIEILIMISYSILIIFAFSFGGLMLLGSPNADTGLVSLALVIGPIILVTILIFLIIFLLTRDCVLISLVD